MGQAGIVGDRTFYLIDPMGELFTSFAHGPLVQVAAEYDAERDRLRVTFPDGETLDGPAAAHGSPVVTDFYGRPVLGRVMGGEIADTLAAYVGRDVRLVRADRAGGGVDVEPITLVSEASVAELAARGGHGGELDARRFRMSFELAGCEPFEEDTWEGLEVTIGGIRVQVVGQVPRCRVTNQDPLTGRRDWNTLAQIARFRPRIPEGGGLPFGMYARVVRSGRVHVGDPVVPAEPRHSPDSGTRASAERVPGAHRTQAGRVLPESV